jgi:hypothetical protein
VSFATQYFAKRAGGLFCFARYLSEQAVRGVCRSRAINLRSGVAGVVEMLDNDGQENAERGKVISGDQINLDRFFRALAHAMRARVPPRKRPVTGSFTEAISDIFDLCGCNQHATFIQKRLLPHNNHNHQRITNLLESATHQGGGGL